MPSKSLKFIYFEFRCTQWKRAPPRQRQKIEAGKLCNCFSGPVFNHSCSEKGTRLVNPCILFDSFIGYRIFLLFVTFFPLVTVFPEHLLIFPCYLVFPVS
ncbi:hypothetical protein B9Z55_025440 [Caenorhabditis nigoni]|uniref:Uncharacterized protein n=1 Tax=Caenorhabditis nigoni TaxID=1611254 RepID=A0A2G5SZ58_9PELO|nr:hypothetical protein B9Z55_025440 [Caenorhabditis nigoni]